MPRKRKDAEAPEQTKNNPNVMGLRAEIMDQPIVETLEENYMPYAMIPRNTRDRRLQARPQEASLYYV